VEGIVKLSTGKLISLSEQELVDCDVDGMDQGCEGGLMDNAFEFIIDNGGLTTEGNYPYTGTDGSCNSNKESKSAASITGYEDVPANDEASLQKAVAASLCPLHSTEGTTSSGSTRAAYSPAIAALSSTTASWRSGTAWLGMGQSTG
jgi:hypothetical protein